MENEELTQKITNILDKVLDVYDKFSNFICWLIIILLSIVLIPIGVIMNCTINMLAKTFQKNKNKL